MNNRFTFKDAVFAFILILVLGAVIWASAQFSRQEHRLNDVRTELSKLNVLLASGVRTYSTTQAEGVQGVKPVNIRRKNEQGGEYVFYPEAPTTPREPHGFPDYASGDWIVQNLGSEPAVVTPYIDKDAYGNEVQRPVLETLITRNPETLLYEPYLAESYETFPKELRYRFVLRKNIWFSDRTPITADDVVFSFTTVMTPGIEADSLQSYLKKIEYVKKIDDRTIDIKLHEPYFQGLEVTGQFFEIIPQHLYAFKDVKEYNARTDHLIGSGPYLFDPKKWEKGQQITLVRNENYWGTRPSFDRIVYRFISNSQAALQAFQNEEIDGVTPQPDQFIKFSSDPEFLKKFKVFKYQRPNAGYRYIGWNLRKPIFKDKITRQALTMLIDRRAIIHTIEKDLSSEITGPFSPIVPQNDKSIQPWPYDPEGARKKLTDAGWKLNSNDVLERDGVEFRFSLMIPAQSSNYEQIASYVKEQFKKVGIDVRILPTEFSVLVDKLNNRDFDASMLRWTGSIEGDPYQIWHSNSAKDKGSNAIGFANAEADKLIEDARKELDEEKRMVLWHKFHQILNEEQPYVFLHTSLSTSFLNGRIKNAEPYLVGVNRDDWYVPSLQQKYR